MNEQVQTTSMASRGRWVVLLLALSGVIGIAGGTLAGMTLGTGDGSDPEPVVDVGVGDKVLFSKYAGTEVKFEGDELLVMREDDIMGVFEK